MSVPRGLVLEVAAEVVLLCVVALSGPVLASVASGLILLVAGGRLLPWVSGAVGVVDERAPD